MGLFFLSLVASTILLCLVYAAAKGHGMAAAGWLTAATTLVFSVLFMPALMFHSLGTLLSAVVCGALKLGTRSVVAASLAFAIASHAYLMSLGWNEMRELAELRAKYPLEPVAERLAYEVSVAEPTATPQMLGSQIEQRLNNFETRLAASSRPYMLEALHERVHDEFVAARGFGPTRMMRVSAARIDLPPRPPVVLPAPPTPEPTYPDAEEPLVPLAQPTPSDVVRPAQHALLEMHDRGLEDFFERGRMGYIKDRQRVAGFEPHRFLAMPTFSPSEPAHSGWQVVGLELVSLLKHETPVAYVSRHLPQMEQLKHVPTRALDGFERSAVERLRADEDLIVDDRPDRIRMVGSLRAGRDCLQCHSVRRGDLLGAFTYELVPERPAPMRQDNAKPLGPQAILSTGRILLAAGP